jgi:hypothetical protein
LDTGPACSAEEDSRDILFSCVKDDTNRGVDKRTANCLIIISL